MDLFSYRLIFHLIFIIFLYSCEETIVHDDEPDIDESSNFSIMGFSVNYDDNNDIISIYVETSSYENIISIAAKNNLYICIMHMQNNPENMQNDPKYNNVTKDIFNYLKEKMTLCINYGVEKDKIIIDPGFGFGKTLDHNYTLLKNLDKFSALSNNILIGISRKSMIGNLLDKSVDDRLEGSLAATTISLVNKASIIRTHDVLETKIVSNAIKRIIDSA